MATRETNGDLVLKFAYLEPQHGKALNVTAEFFAPSNMELGRRLPNGTWTGASGDIINGKADMTVAGWLPTRCAVTTCLDYMAEIRYGVLVPMPKRKMFTKAFTQPFSAEVWICLLISSALMGSLIYAVRNKGCPNFDILKFLGVTLGISQKFIFPGNASPMLLYITTWYIGMALLSKSYSALVIGYFADPLEPRVKNLKQLLALTDLATTISPNVNTLVTSIKASTVPEGREYAARMKEVPLALDLFYFPETNETFTTDAIHAWLKLEAAGRDKWNNFYVVSKPGFFPIPTGYRTIFFRKNFPRIKEVWKVWNHYLEHGFQDYNERSTYKLIVERIKAKARTLKELGLRPIGLGDVYGIFILWLAGIGVGTLVFGVEIAAARKLRIIWGVRGNLKT